MSRTAAAGISGQRNFLAAAAIFFVLLLALVAISWPFMLDDALIHLRYADYLLLQHRITYDGVHASFGTSSLLYVTVLAGLRMVWTSPLLPRAVSSVAYAGFYLVLAWSLYRELSRRQDAPRFLWWMAVTLLAVAVTPFAVRWLDDGMETGLVFLDTILGASLLRRLIARPEANAPWLLVLFVYGLLTVLLRVELLLLLGCITAIGALEFWRAPGRTSMLLKAALPLLGGLFGCGLILLTMHALLPDTAIAKAYGLGHWSDTLEMSGRTLVSSFSFGVGLLGLWVMSLAALRATGQWRLGDLLANSLLPCLLLPATLRGQQIQGIRYFGWTMLFPLLWNLFRVMDLRALYPKRAARRLRVAVKVLLILLLPATVGESYLFARVFTGRVAALNLFRAQHLEVLRGQLGITEEVGFLGYFTQADLCDSYGLVNGRAVAKLDYPRRFARCMAMHPTFAFGNEQFLEKVTQVQRLTHWSVCGVYSFHNVLKDDVHYLVVAPAMAGVACRRDARFVAEVIPGL